MKRNTLLYLFAILTLSAFAQESTTFTIDKTGKQDDMVVTNTMEADFRSGCRDSLLLPALDDKGRVMSGMCCPYSFGGSWGGWRLHEGVNVSLGAAAFFFSGKGASGGAGFSQNLSLQYAVPLSPRLSFALGGYLNNICWRSTTFRDAGLTAVLAYRFNERWEGYLYGQKSMARNTPVPFLFQDLNDMCDRIGAAVRYNFSPSFSIQMSVESRAYERGGRWW